jgi:hypothetical protein
MSPRRASISACDRNAQFAVTQKTAAPHQLCGRLLSSAYGEDPMRRRDFIAIISNAAIAWPLAARSQQRDRMRRIAVLMGLAEDDPETKARLAAFRQGLVDQSTGPFRQSNTAGSSAQFRRRSQCARHRAYCIENCLPPTICTPRSSDWRASASRRFWCYRISCSSTNASESRCSLWQSGCRRCPRFAAQSRHVSRDQRCRLIPV